MAEVDLAAARNHIQQFKEISQASEEALASLNATHDEYKSSTEAQLTASWVYFASFCAYFHENSRCLQAQQEALQSTLKNVEQELEQARTSLAETKRTFESAREEWQVDKKTLEDAIVDMSAAEKNLAEDRLSRESDVQVHEERVKVNTLLAYLRLISLLILLVVPRLLRTGIRARSLRMRRLSRPTRISSGDSMTSK